MNLNLSGHHVDVSPALRDYVSNKLQRVERHFDRLIGANIVLTVEKLLHKAEATIHASGANIHAHAAENDMYAAIDALIDKLDEQARRHKEKLHDHKARKAQKHGLQSPLEGDAA